MNRFKDLAVKAALVDRVVVGMKTRAAQVAIESMDMKHRLVKIDGQACMVTADVQMDRIGLIVENGIVVGTQAG